MINANLFWIGVFACKFNSLLGHSIFKALCLLKTLRGEHSHFAKNEQ